jgi:hypothetical protein
LLFAPWSLCVGGAIPRLFNEIVGFVEKPALFSITSWLRQKSPFVFYNIVGPICNFANPGIHVTQVTTIGCGSVFRTPLTRTNGNFVSSIPSNRLLVFNEIGSFVPPKKIWRSLRFQ